MRSPDTHDSSSQGCTTTEAFDNYGVPDGNALLRRTYYLLTETERETAPPPELFAHVADAFRTAFLQLTDATDVPPAVAAAIEDATYAVGEQFDEGVPDLRQTLLPAFYQSVAGYHCAYRLSVYPDWSDDAAHA